MTDLPIRPIDVVSANPVGTARLAALVQWVRRFGFVVATYLVVTLSTSSPSMGDTVDYVESIVLFSKGVNHWMWDFAHLLWRPLGWVLSSLFAPVTRLFVGSNQALNVMLTLNSVSWVAGLVTVICLHSLALRVSRRTWIANTVSLLFVFTNVFLTWTQVGSAYVPGLALVLVALHISMMRAEHSVDVRTAILAGTALAGAVCVWVPYILVVPTVAAAGLCLFGLTRERIRFAVQTTLAFSIITAVAYLAVIAELRFTTLKEVTQWIIASGHGVDYAGFKRMCFGFARAFVNMGNDGVLFKRYFLRDPFNPVLLRDLFGIALWKIGAVYGFVFSVLGTLVASRNNKGILALFVINSVPVTGLAFFFGSSEPERYLPLFPMFFLALAASLRVPARTFRAIVFAFVCVVVVTNTAVMAWPSADRKQKEAEARLSVIWARLDARSLVFAATFQDELVTFNRTYPFHPINRSGRFRISALVSPGTSWNLHWCEDFASRALLTWKRGGTTWVSRRALARHPRPEWNWAEGDDRRVSWNDFPLLFSHLELGQPAGGADGFVQLLPTAKNEEFLSRLTTRHLVEERMKRKAS